MREDLAKKLTACCPKLYRDRYGMIRNEDEPMYFACGDGWYQILWIASKKLEALIERDEKDYAPEIPVYAIDVKEKFGTIRVYLSAETQEMSDVIQELEIESAVTCELCGNPGQLENPNHWYMTRCDTCEKK